MAQLLSAARKGNSFLDHRRVKEIAKID